MIAISLQEISEAIEAKLIGDGTVVISGSVETDSRPVSYTHLTLPTSDLV